MLVHRFVALVATALALTMTSAHVLEMAPKLAYSYELYTAVNGTLYRYFAIVGGIYTIVSLIAVVTLAWRARRQRSAHWTLFAALAIVASFATWLVLVVPVNQRIAEAGPAAVEAWVALRPRWEYGHLIGFVLTLIGFCALVVAALVEIPRPHGIHAEVSRVVHAPPERLMALYMDYTAWPQLFPATIRGVRWVRTDGPAITVEVDHASAGTVPNVITPTSEREIQLDERKPSYQARFINRFEPVPGGTRYTVVADIAPRGRLRALAWLARPFVRSRIRRFVVEPMRERAEQEQLAATARA